jgi:hypothetical protein
MAFLEAREAFKPLPALLNRRRFHKVNVLERSTMRGYVLIAATVVAAFASFADRNIHAAEVLVAGLNQEAAAKRTSPCVRSVPLPDSCTAA